MEKTAVEWLRKELETIPNYSAFYTNNYQWIDSIINEAKEMEKQQIINAFNDGYRSGHFDDGKLGSKYYQEYF